MTMRIPNFTDHWTTRPISATAPSAEQESTAVPHAPTVKPLSPNVGFYETQEAPWLGENLGKDQYLEKLTKESSQALHRAYDDYHDFKENLKYLNPVLGGKHFGITLEMDRSIRITDPDGVLTAAEISYLTEQLNDRPKLVDNLQTHARTVLELVDHDTEKFGGKYRLDMESFKHIIDYGQIFSRNSIGNFMDTWAYQIERYADKREEPLVITSA
jgi:hypothetical protein